MAKKKLIEVARDNKMGIYSFGGGVSFALCSSPEDGRKQVTPFFTCRDYINDSLIAFYNDDWRGIGSIKKTELIDINRLRLLIGLTENQATEDKIAALYKAKRYLNIYETLAGFEKKSLLTRVKLTGGKKEEPCWLLTGPGEWMKCSQLVSMVTLIIRSCLQNVKFVEEAETVEEVEEVFGKMVAAAKGGYSGDAAYHLPSAHKMFRVIAENFNDLFKDLSADELYPRDRTTRWHGAGGIVSLSKFASNITRLDSRLKKLAEKG
jgi:hypothetical protein